jgi:hypothetical protein
LTRWRESYNLLKAEEMSASLISFFKLPGSSPAIDLVFAPYWELKDEQRSGRGG